MMKNLVIIINDCWVLKKCMQNKARNWCKVSIEMTPLRHKLLFGEVSRLISTNTSQKKYLKWSARILQLQIGL